MAVQRTRKKRVRFVPEGPPNTVGLNIYPPISKAAISEFVLLPPDLRWRPATTFGILMNAQPEIWHAGHVNAIIGIGDIAIVGSQTGGVWLINPAYGAIPQFESFPARSLSWDWANPHVTTLAAGPDGPTIVYAGGEWLDGSNSSLHVIELVQVLGGVEFVRAAEIAVPWGLSINQIVVQSSPRRVILASSSGVWWSSIPTNPMNVGGYSWRRALAIPADVSGIALGPGNSVVAALDGNGVAGNSGFRVGTWTGATLTFTPSAVAGGTPAMQRTSIASCKGQRSVLYAVSAATDDESLGGVFRSADGGKTFAPCQLPMGAGNLGWYNNCIDVHPDNADVVALGWRTGPFISADRGQTWINTSNSHLHSDVHAVTYSETSTGVYLWAGTDGGVCLSTDGGAHWDSRYNKHLRNLQYYGPVDQLGMSPFDTSRWHAGMHGGATQDNGNLWTRAGDEGIRSAVRQFEGGDGNTVMFVTDTIALHRNNTLTIQPAATEIGNRIRRSNYRPATHDMDNSIGVVVPAEGYPDGLPTPSAACVVRDPRYRRDNVRMLAVFGVGTELHGYFDTADPGSMRKLADVGLGSSGAANPRNITAVAALDGYRVLAGTSDGHIYSVESATGILTDQTTSFGSWSGRKVSRLLWPAASVRYATLDNWAVARWMPQLSVRVDGKRGVWLVTRGLLTSGATDLEYAALETGGSALFATTDYGVEVSIDEGNSWTVISRGLPKRPQCRDIRLGTNGEGRPTLFVGTYGWGAFMAELPRKPEGKFGHIPDEVAEILFGVLAGGGGVEIVGGHIKVVPPHEPARALATALVLLAVSQRSTEEVAALTERAAADTLRIAGIDGLEDLANRVRADRRAAGVVEPDESDARSAGSDGPVPPDQG